jgi:hypothetical protein
VASADCDPSGRNSERSSVVTRYAWLVPTTANPIAATAHTAITRFGCRVTYLMIR